ncbi:acetyl-CoA carboxylase biotin carboxyl carrier protein [Streptomyces sp. NPDC087894]|uniref:acetyl-CoA carboxylase biotin carboxyl carrier protein n=1 Tax=Streptomyces sp. NPDC087894 TaxID=3365816 RepID=UPI0037F1217B
MTTETTTAADTMTVEELRTQTRLLADELPGTLRRITLKAGGISVDVEWETAPAAAAAPTPAAALATPPAGLRPAAAPACPDRPAGLVQVTAPLVGTFYQASSPGGEPFVQVGDIVEPGHQLAIIEAMKLLNSITADVRGRVHAVHPQDGEVVEYAQPLFDLVPVD